MEHGWRGPRSGSWKFNTKLFSYKERERERRRKKEPMKEIVERNGTDIDHG